MAKQQIRTYTKHERTPPSAENDRGVRNWSAVKIVGPLAFVVDICVEVQCPPDIKRWLATSIYEVAQIQQSHKPFQWTQVFVSMRAPRGAPGGLVFEEINEVYQSGRFGSNIYRLTNGMAFMPDSNQDFGDEDGNDPSIFKLVYSKLQPSSADCSLC